MHLSIVFFIAGALSSFTLFDMVRSEDPSKSQIGELTSSEQLKSDRKKRSQEVILFGNQQNKPNGLVDDVMGMAEEDSPLALPLTKANDSEDSFTSVVPASPPREEEQSENAPEEEKMSSHVMMASGSWFPSTTRDSSSEAQYLSSPAALHVLPDGLDDAEDVYRRKRDLWRQSKRSLRTSLGGLIRKRGVRLPRRSMRLKRQADVRELLGLFDDQQPQVSSHIFGGRAQTVPNKRRVPDHLRGYRRGEPSSYVFRHRDDGILSSANDMNDGNDALEDDSMEDIDNLMLLPPNTRYMEVPQLKIASPFRSREEESEMIQEWLARHTSPSVFRVARRSAPFFYPIDYRYITPGLKKRSSFRNGAEDASDVGKWGRVVAVPEAYASPEDVARLYGLAGLMADGDEPTRRRRSA